MTINNYEPQTDLLVTEYPQDGEVTLIGRDKTEAVVMAYDVYKELTELQTITIEGNTNGIMQNACISKEKDWWNGALLKAIEKQDLIDRKGEWIVRFPYEDTGKARTCSNCNITQTVNVYNGVVRFKFCPYCGARMKGVDDE